MANYDLDISNYHSSHMAMWHSLTKTSHAGYRFCDTSSTQQHTITVKDGLTGPSCVLYLRQSDLYLVGFKNAANHVFAFHDQAPSTYNTRLTMSVNYAHVSTTAKGAAITRQTLVDAITAFDGHTGTSWNTLSLPFLSMALLVSEAMRFKNIYETMRGVASDRANGRYTTFNVWASLVTSWNANTTNLHGLHKLMQRPSQVNVKTWHHFTR
ncbi:ribosome-inactivating family protein [Polyangium mundeleinium]|uniref:Ribosome-inactivating family protein n=1 Tax=Polyangium mundeleinium TaxID=2995306 RepID=A0ABT5EL94_9BACT|nr:ribosome-inactivating family protein [Polyangium mundeleinium]MDC0742620.1 ribosome-inactivating family protein [Polyangium mundeleinium]